MNESQDEEVILVLEFRVHATQSILRARITTQGNVYGWYGTTPPEDHFGWDWRNIFSQAALGRDECVTPIINAALRDLGFPEIDESREVIADA